MNLINRNTYLFFITLCFSVWMLFSHPQGDDELVSIFIANKLAEALLNLEIYEFIKIIGQNYHAPGRELMLLPFLTFLPTEIFSGRILSILIYCFLIIQIFGLLNLLNSNNKNLNFFSTILISISGLFQIQAMVSIHGFVTLFGIIIIKKLIKLDLKFDNLKEIFSILLTSFFAFFFSNTFILISAPLYIILMVFLYKNNISIKKISYLFFFTLLFYLTYYMIFLGYPYYLLYSGQVEEPFGQLYKYYFRVNNSYLNINSFVDNFKVTNFYTFPIIFYLISLIGFFYTVLKFKKIFFLLIFYFLIFNFVINIHTGQHYLSFVIWTLPFGVVCISNLNHNLKKFFKIIIIILLPFQALYTFYFHINSYAEKEYPHEMKKIFFAKSVWSHNIKYQLEAIKEDLEKLEEKKILNLSGVQWTIYFEKKNFFKNDKVEPTKYYKCEDLLELMDNREIDGVLYLENNILECFNNNKQFKKKKYENSSFNLVINN